MHKPIYSCLVYVSHYTGYRGTHDPPGSRKQLTGVTGKSSIHQVLFVPITYPLSASPPLLFSFHLFRLLVCVFACSSLCVFCPHVFIRYHLRVFVLVFMYRLIYLFYLCIYSCYLIYQYLYLFMYSLSPFISYLFIYQFIYSFVYLSICLSFCCHTIYLCISFLLSIYPIISPSLPLPIKISFVSMLSYPILLT